MEKSENPTIKNFEQWVQSLKGDELPTVTTPITELQADYIANFDFNSPLGEHCKWTLENIHFPEEFYPGNGICRPGMKKVDPLPFYRIQGNDRQVITYNPLLRMFETISIKAAAERLERWASRSIGIPNRKAMPTDACTIAEKVIHCIADLSPQAVFCDLLAGYEGGAYQNTVGNLFVVNKTIPIAPAAYVSPEDIQKAADPPPGFVLLYDKWKPLYKELFYLALWWKNGGDDSQIQIDTLFKLLAGTRAVMMGKAELKIPMICLVGDAGAGKSLIAARILKNSLTREKSNPTNFLYGEVRFNSSIMGHPVWLVDDQEIRKKDCKAKIKEIIVGDGIQIEAKNEKATPFVHPYILIVLCANGDRFSRKALPIVGNDNQEKIIILKTYPGIPNHSSEEWAKLIDETLPYFLAYLDYQVWPQLKKEISLRDTKTGRLVVPGWQNPEISGEIFADTTDGKIHELLQDYLKEHPEDSGQEYKASEWLNRFCSMSRMMDALQENNCGTVTSFGKAIERLMDNPNSKEYYSRRKTREARLIKMTLEPSTP